MRKLLAALLTTAALGAGACGSGPSDDQCEALLGHLLDMELAKGGGKNLTPEMKADLEKQKKAVTEYTHDKFMEACREKAAKTIVACGANANDEKALAACDEGDSNK
jgi:hypothetical protein